MLYWLQLLAFVGLVSAVVCGVSSIIVWFLDERDKRYWRYRWASEDLDGLLKLRGDIPDYEVEMREWLDGQIGQRSKEIEGLFEDWTKGE